ncbi:hypothetical protein DFH11DRAFT_1547435 [Phellopilus nigrolimitatus]|nr:hypothetical protein DFH11DRAFT_1547435 [Phellopilus nigrolimitatus]
MHWPGHSESESHVEAKEAYDTYEAEKKEKGEHAHPLISGALAFGAMKAYDHHRKKNGQEGLSKMQEIMFTAAAAGIDELVEKKVIPKGKEEIEKRKLKKHTDAMVADRFAYEQTQQAGSSYQA